MVTTHTQTQTVDVGIPDDTRKKVADGLSRVLADTYTLYLKTHYYHWNVTGPEFPVLHDKFEEQYRELWAAGDDIAERIRALGFMSPGTYAEFNKLSDIEEDTSVPDARTMIANLLDGHETVARTIRPALHAANEAGDDVSGDMLTTRLAAHEKTAWMLRSQLQ